MRKTALFILFVFSVFLMNDQSFKEFPNDDNEFIKTYTSFLKTCTRLDCIETNTWFEKSFISSKSNAYLPIIKTISNKLLARKAPVYPTFFNFTNLLATIDTTKVTPENVAKNLEALNVVLDQTKVGNIKLFNQFNEYLLDLFRYNNIYLSKSKTWKSTNDFQTLIEQNQPVYVFKNTDFIGTTDNDTIVLKNIDAKYFPLSNQLIGTTGKIFLTRAGFDAVNNFVEFKDFDIDLQKSEINIEHTKFSFKPYLEEILDGTYSDRLLLTKGQAKNYPKFVSNRDDIEFKTNGKEVKLVGAFMLEGTDTYCIGTDAKNAQLTIFDKNNHPKIKVQAKKFNVKNFEQIKVEDALMEVELDSSTIVHPYVNFSYDSKTKTVKAYRDLSKPLAKQPFLSDYHQMFIYADEFKWNMDSSQILLGMIGISDLKPAIFESYNYYYPGLENRYKAGNEAGPLLKIYRYYESTLDRNIDAQYIAGDINPTAPFLQTEQVFYKLVEDGYIGYNPSTRTIYVKDKLLNQALSSKKQIDYDNIKFASFKKITNAKMDVKTNELEIYGVEEIKVSNKAQVKIIPGSDTIKVGKNRNMKFGGKVIAGKVDFVGTPFDFDYDSYSLRMDKIDSLVLFIPEGDGKPNENGEVKLVPSQTPIENISGTLFIAEADDKAGTRDNLRYPYFSSRDTANTFYDKGKNGKEYDRDKFKFEMEPFQLDSLTIVATENFNVDGVLKTGGIFEDIKTNVSFQEDKSLGTKIDASEKGLKLYGREGKYFNALKLSKDGLGGKGDFEFGSARLFADTAMFFLDSVYAEIDSMHITESSKYKFPDVSSGNVLMNWSIPSDSVVITPTGENKKFTMYNNSVDLSGKMILQKDKLKGVGTLEWTRTKLKSDKIDFSNRSFDVKNGQLRIAADDGSALIKSEDVDADFNLDTKIANITLNQNDTLPLTTFKYNTNPKYLTFDFDKNTVQLKSYTPSATFFLESTQLTKEYLRFETNKADLNLNDNTIYIGGINELKLADSKVLPSNNEIYIEADGSIRLLKNSVVIFNANKQYHKITNAEIEVLSKNKFQGSGIYTFKTVDDIIQQIPIAKIDVDNSVKKEIVKEEGKSKTKIKVSDEDKIYTYARTEILEEDKIKLNKNIFFKGNMSFDSKHKELDLEGYAKIVLKVVETDWIPFSQKLDPENPEVSMDSILAKATNLVNGVLYDRSTGELYTSVLQEKRASTDPMLFSVKGNMSYDNANSNTIVFGNSNAFKKSIIPGASAMKFDEITKKVDASGIVNLGLNMGVTNAIAVGSFEYNNDQKMMLKADLAIKTIVSNTILTNVINAFVGSDSLFVYSNYRKKDTLQRTLAYLTNDTIEGKYLLGSIYMKDSLFKPSSMPYDIVLNGTNFLWDNEEASFKSISPINLPYFGNNIVKRPYTAYVEMAYGGTTDFINILLISKNNDWLYLKFKNRQIGIASSVPGIFEYLVGLPESERETRDNKSKMIILDLLPASLSLKIDFEQRMEDFKERYKTELGIK